MRFVPSHGHVHFSRVDYITPARATCSQHVAWLQSIRQCVSPISDSEGPATYLPPAAPISTMGFEL